MPSSWRGELAHLGAVWELDADGARERARSLAERATRGEDVGPLAGTVCGWKDCFDVAGLHTTGGAPWRAASGPATSSAVIVQRMEAAGRDLARQARDDAAGLGDDGSDARPADVPQPARSRARPGRLVLGLGRRGRHGDRRSRAGHRRRRQRAPSGRGLRRRRLQADLRLRSARRLHALRPELRHGRVDRAQRRRGGACSTRCSRTRRPRTLEGGLGGLRIAFLAGYFTAALTDDVAAMLERTRGRVRAGEIDIAWSQDDNRCMAPIFVAEPGAYVLAHDPDPDPELYDPTTLADVAGVAGRARRRLPAGPRGARRGAAALRCGRCRLRRAALRLRPVPAVSDRRARQDHPHERSHEALQRRWAGPPCHCPRASIATACRSGCRSSVCPGSEAVVLRAAAALETAASGVDVLAHSVRTS